MSSRSEKESTVSTPPHNIAFNRTSRRMLPAAKAARSNSTGAASRCLHFATRCMQLIGGKQRAAPASASLKSGSPVNVDVRRMSHILP
jgi:hypothetical protein